MLFLLREEAANTVLYSLVLSDQGWIQLSTPTRDIYTNHYTIKEVVLYNFEYYFKNGL